jgi:hypothetical protein
MPDPIWMSVVIYQRQQAASMGGGERQPYADVDAEPLSPEPEREAASVANRLSVRLHSLFQTRGRAVGASR